MAASAQEAEKRREGGKAFRVLFMPRGSSEYTEQQWFATKKEAQEAHAARKKRPDFRKVVTADAHDRAVREDDTYGRGWIIPTAIPTVRSYGGNLTTRALHYRPVALGMFNTQRHYNRVVQAMGDARWEGLLEFSDFLDHERETIGRTNAEPTDPEGEAERKKRYIRHHMADYRKGMRDGQRHWPEVFIEKKALQGVFERACSDWQVALNPRRGHPSPTYLHGAKGRFDRAIEPGAEPIILYFGDYDPSGEDIPRSLKEVAGRMGGGGRRSGASR